MSGLPPAPLSRAIAGLRAGDLPAGSRKRAAFVSFFVRFVVFVIAV